ncbi:MAG: hypothetical protein ACYCO9_05115 [Streptosporangiaceae bacterium]
MPVAVSPSPLGVPLAAESGRHISVIGAGDIAGWTGQSAGAASSRRRRYRSAISTGPARDGA